MAYSVVWGASERARRSKGVGERRARRVMTGAAYCVRADGGIYAEAFKAGGYAAIGWLPTRDLSDVPRDDATSLGTVYDSEHSSDLESRPRGHDIGQVGQFLWRIEPGDVLVTPKRPSEQRVLVGIVRSGYYYEAAPDDGCPYPHRRKVEWFDESILRSSFSVPIQRILRVPRTVFEVSPPDELLEAVGLEAPTPEPVERMEENISTLVLERLLELDPDEFEVLVTELLTAIGFEAEKTGKTGDGGVDVEGTLTIYGFASIDLRVQVKRYKLTNKIGHQDIKQFRASVPEKAQGAFVTTSGYTKQARGEAEREGFKRIGLLDGRQLVDILTEEYDRLPSGVRERLGLRRALVPV
jgi:restriction system protein